MTSFRDFIKLYHLKYVIKRTSQNFFIFKTTLSKILVAPLSVLVYNAIKHKIFSRKSVKTESHEASL